MTPTTSRSESDPPTSSETPTARVRITYATPPNVPQTFTLALHRSWAPNSHDRFLEMARTRYFDGQRLVRAVPGFVLDWNYAPACGLTEKTDRTVRYYDGLSWLAVDAEERKSGGRRRPNRAGTVAFGQEEDGRTKTEVFVNMVDNGKKLDELGFWPFGELESGSGSVARELAGWLVSMNFSYGDVFFSGGADGVEARKRQVAVMDGGNTFIDSKYPGMTRLVSVEILTEEDEVAVA